MDELIDSLNKLFLYCTYLNYTVMVVFLIFPNALIDVVESMTALDFGSSWNR